MIGLLVILLLVLILPFTLKVVERNLEIFILVMGFLTALISNVFNRNLLIQALLDPILITLAVFMAGLMFKWFQHQLKRSVKWLTSFIPHSLFLALVVVVLGLISSIITAIIATLVLVSIVTLVQLDRQSEVRFVVLACFAIGLGAALTPVGEPLSTIAISKLNQDFFYLIRLIGRDIFAALAILGWLTIVLVRPVPLNQHRWSANSETYGQIMIRAVKVYLFIMGLTFFGHGFQPFIDRYLIDLHPLLLYWINMISAVLDNATLTAAEISPAMNEESIRALLLGLLISGGMLIPGNIPNIIAAGQLNITSREWARFGLPVGLSFMLLFFIILLFIR